MDSTYLQALLESGSPSEQSREVLAHQRLRSVTSNLLRSHPIISALYHLVWCFFVLCGLDDDSNCFQALLELGSPSERSKWELAHDLRAKCYEQFIAKSSYQPTCPIPQSALLTAQRKIRPKGCLYKGAFRL